MIITKLELQAKQELQAKREKELTHFNSQLSIIYSKAKELDSRQFGVASTAANNLYSALKKLKENYCNGTINYPNFKKDSIQAINTARIELKQHRGWKELLANVALFILGLGFGYLACCAYKGSFFKFNTDSVNKLDDLHNSINAGSPAI